MRLDFLQRLLKYLPFSWFKDSTLIRALMSAYATACQYLSDLIDFCNSQSRVLTSELEFLDLARKDFLGEFLLIKPHEKEENYKKRLAPSLLPYGCELKGLISAVETITQLPVSIVDSSIAAEFLNFNFFLDYAYLSFYCPLQILVFIDLKNQLEDDVAIYFLDLNWFLNDTAFIPELHILFVWTEEEILEILYRYCAVGIQVILNDVTKLRTF